MTAPQAPPLTVIFARLKTGAPGRMAVPRARLAGVAAASWWRAVPGVTHGRQPAVRPQGAKAELPARLR